MNRFDRITAILVQLQAKRVVSGPALAGQFGVSLRTIYRDLRTLELAGVPLFGEAGVGYSLAEGYRLPPVLFTRAEATALLTAEKLAARLTDAPTAQLSGAAMDKLRAVLRRPDRDYLEALAPHLQVLGPAGPPRRPAAAAYQLLLTAVATHQVVHLRYQAAEAAAPTTRDIEPIGLYLSRQWHVVAYCRLRQDFREFLLDRIEQLAVRAETFAARPETLYWATRAERRPREKVVLRFQPAAVRPEAAQRLHDTKRQYGWAHEHPLADGSLEMTLFLGSLPYLADWLLPYAGAVTVLEPPALRAQLCELARRAHDFFCPPS